MPAKAIRACKLFLQSSVVSIFPAPSNTVQKQNYFTVPHEGNHGSTEKKDDSNCFDVSTTCCVHSSRWRNFVMSSWHCESDMVATARLKPSAPSAGIGHSRL